ncbi:MAG: hypothetical protein JW829_00645 [Pirellulales bacterium]|nr:hypothetical protein [Pirellulales bacterium]
MLDFEVQRCTRRCAVHDRPFAPGETFYSVLEVHGADVVRRDYSEEAWEGPAENAIGWWKSRIPEPLAKKAHWAPNDVMLDLLERWADDPARQDIRYVLALLLIRRRVLREEEDEIGQKPGQLTVYCPRKEERYEIAVAVPDRDRAEEIQKELSEMLFAHAE